MIRNLFSPKIFIPFCAALLFFTINGGALAQNNVTTRDTFPSNFGEDNTYLYVLTERGYWQQNKAMKKYFKQYYKGDYEVMDNTAYLSAPKKDGVHVYTFQMLYRHDSSQSISELPWHSCMVRDAETGKGYEYPKYIASYKKVLKQYVPRLEQIRKRNSFNNRK